MTMWDEEYNTNDYIFGREPNDFLKDRYSSIPLGKVLCLAEGEGRNSVFLAKLGYDVTGVDTSRVGLEKAQKLASEHGVTVELICADLTTFDLGEKQWDGIVSIFCHFPEIQRRDLYARIEKALKPTGTLLIESYTPNQLNYKTGGPPVAEMMTSKATLEKELPNIKFSHLMELERVVAEGRNHSGLGSVVQGIGSLRGCNV